jgi:rare lipoprotein A
MLLRLITVSVFTAAVVCASPADKPSPFPSKRQSQPAAQIAPAPDAMSGTASFFRLKDDTPASDSLTAAHASLPIGTRIRVVNHGNGKSVTVRVTDHFGGGNGLVISVSRPAAEQLGFVRDGTAQVTLELVSSSATR